MHDQSEWLGEENKMLEWYERAAADDLEYIKKLLIEHPEYIDEPCSEENMRIVYSTGKAMLNTVVQGGFWMVCATLIPPAGTLILLGQATLGAKEIKNHFQATRSRLNWTLLDYAAESNAIHVARHLIFEGANTKNQFFMKLASENGHQDFVRHCTDYIKQKNESEAQRLKLENDKKELENKLKSVAYPVDFQLQQLKLISKNHKLHELRLDFDTLSRLHEELRLNFDTLLRLHQGESLNQGEPIGNVNVSSPNKKLSDSLAFINKCCASNTLAIRTYAIKLRTRLIASGYSFNEVEADDDVIEKEQDDWELIERKPDEQPKKHIPAKNYLANSRGAFFAHRGADEDEEEIEKEREPDEVQLVDDKQPKNHIPANNYLVNPHGVFFANWGANKNNDEDEEEADEYEDDEIEKAPYHYEWKPIEPEPEEGLNY